MQFVAGKDVLLVEIFDREHSTQGWCRRSIVSGLTVLGLDERWAREASYINLIDKIRLDGVNFKEDALELFSRMVFNVLIGNTDDHARNHAFFVEGEKIELTPAYDICPQNRSGGEASHGMKMYKDSNLSQIKICVQSAADFGITEDQAISIIRSQIEVIANQFNEVCDEITVPTITRRILWRRAVLNPYIFTDGFEHLDPVNS
jgi:serine/threonine-protein kinase HipA